MLTSMRKQVILTIVLLSLSTSFVLYTRSSGTSALTTDKLTKDCICKTFPNITTLPVSVPVPLPVPLPNCSKKEEEIKQLNKAVTDVKSQIDCIRQHHVNTRRKLIEERERLRNRSGYYNQTKKLAICFSGQLRSIGRTQDRIRQELFSLFGEKNIDIFMFVPKVINNGQEQPIPSISWNVTELTTYQQQDLREPKAGQLYHYGSGFQGWLQQLYGISGCYNIIREYQERNRIHYEWIARARPDVVYFYPDAFKSSFSLQNLDSNVWWIPDNQHWDGANDKFMLSSNINYELYADFENLYYYTGLYKPEVYHKLMVEYYGIKINSIKSFTTKIMRQDGSYGPW